MIELIGFAPDLDPLTQGVFTDCTNVIPTLRGFKSGNADSPVMPALAGACSGASGLVRADNQVRFIAGTASKLYEASSGAWSDVSRSGNYTSGVDTVWRFAQFGNVSLATNQTDIIQASSSGTFADLSGAPKARILEVASGFVLAFATNDATYGDRPDGWWCSGLFDHTAWAPSQATQAANGRFLSSPGEIRAARRLGDDVVVYKQKSMYIGTYVGPPVIWAWRQIPGEIGALSQESVVNIDSAHVFIGADDFWMFDGSRPVSIGAPIKKWFFANSHPSYRYKTVGYFDRENYLVFWYFVSTNSSGTLDKCLVYNTKTNRWGRADRAVRIIVSYTPPGVTIDTLNSLSSSINGLPNISFDSPQWFNYSSIHAYFDSSSVLRTIGSGSASSSIKLGAFGDDSEVTTLKRVFPRFISAPSSCSMTHFWKMQSGEPETQGSNVTIYDGRFDVLSSARWHSARLDFTGDFEITGIRWEAGSNGTY